MRVLVTGATGFLAGALMPLLLERGHTVRAVARHPVVFPEGVEYCRIGNIGPSTDWSRALSGIDAVIHLAARVHVMKEDAPDPAAAFREVNSLGTRHLAESAGAAGIKRLVYISSIGVNGNETDRRGPFQADDPANPHNAYTLSKWEAEQALAGISANTGLATVVLRPPLVYGPGAKGNFLRLLEWVDRGIPLPLASIDNRRSFIYAGNLASAIVACLEHPNAANRTFLVADGKDISSPDLIRALAMALGRRPRLFHVPVALLQLACRITGKHALATRLLSSLTVDGQAIRHALDWQPPYTLEQGLSLTAHSYRKQRYRLPTDHG